MTEQSRRDAIEARKQAVLSRVSIMSVVSPVVKLGRGKNPRGRCPFHNGKSDSFTVYTDKSIAKCWSCAWAGDAIRFVADQHFNGDWMAALRDLEGDGSSGGNVGGRSSTPISRERVEHRQPDFEMVSSIEMARYIWRTSRHEPARLRPYLRWRRIPEAMLGDVWLAEFRFHGACPIVPWREGARPDSVPHAPAMVAMVRRPQFEAEEGAPLGLPVRFDPCGLHVSYLSPDGERSMERTKPNGDPYPKRKMLGEMLGGCVIVGEYAPDRHLIAGEGNETVLSGMALTGHSDPARAFGIAALSLDNLQGPAKLYSNGAWPLFDMRPNMDKQALRFLHNGPVTGLIDADMKPLRGRQDRETGDFLGMKVVETRGGPIVMREISGAERANACAQLFVKGWRAMGCHPVDAVRPPMGQDFNDMAQGVAA